MKNVLSYIAMVVFIACQNNNTTTRNNRVDSVPNEVEYQEAKMTIAEKEATHPLEFLSAGGEYREALIGGTHVIIGQINNNATLTTYKDIVVTLYFYSKTQTKIGTMQKIYYEFIAPGKTFAFKEKITAPNGTKTIGWSVTQAHAQ